MTYRETTTKNGTRMRPYKLNANEPVRIGFLIVAAVILLGNTLTAAGQALADGGAVLAPTLVAFGEGLVAAAMSVITGELVSSRTYGPQTAEDIMSAEFVISQAEREGNA